jgi:hypothetical protein
MGDIMSLFEENLAVISRREIPDFIAEMDGGEAPFLYVGTDNDGVKIFCDNDNKPFIIEIILMRLDYLNQICDN